MTSIVDPTVIAEQILLALSYKEMLDRSNKLAITRIIERNREKPWPPSPGPEPLMERLR
jgi:hypothetical protein